ncbi:MAG TPA: hypothetical protein VLT36_14415 [Candidatus Dormibacteraeota bacterium]|nr:hypothetical protein [Candidatus Dormibacteraeota bacterium]
MNRTTEIDQPSLTPSFRTACVSACQKLAQQLQRAKARLISEYSGLLDGHEQALRLVLNEAEALAWQTEYPQLVFADIAAEKVQAYARWNRRQQALNNSVAAFAA